MPKSVRVSDILAFCEKMCQATGQKDPEIDLECINSNLFPKWWQLQQYYGGRSRRFDDDPDCYCE